MVQQNKTFNQSVKLLNNKTMDLINAMDLWDKLGNTFNSYDDEQGNYVIDFINKDGETEGWFKTYPGQGFGWDYPQSLVDRFKHLNIK